MKTFSILLEMVSTFEIAWYARDMCPYQKGKNVVIRSNDLKKILIVVNRNLIDCLDLLEFLFALFFKFCD